MSDATPTPEPTTTDAAPAEVATVPEPAPIAFPDRAARPETPRAAQREPVEDDDDYVTADERLDKFWRKHKDDDVEISTLPARTDRDGHDEWLVIATVRVDGNLERPSRTYTASASRSTNDPNPVVAARPLETASTAAISRALRYAGFGLAKKPTKTKAA